MVVIEAEGPLLWAELAKHCVGAELARSFAQWHDQDRASSAPTFRSALDRVPLLACRGNVVLGGADPKSGRMKIILPFPLLVGATLALAQPAPPVNYDFDFWAGDWEVTNQANGKLAGHNRIELKHGGRVLVENYTTPGAYTGMSLNAYDGTMKRWHQCWMDNTGGVLDLYGGLVAGKMVLTGETPLPGGGRE
jgi:hypothetical protein